jgi:hypothetical protein
LHISNNCMIGPMTETPSTPPSSSVTSEATTGPVASPPPPVHQPTYAQTPPPAYAPVEQPRHNRLNVVAAWVGIVAGVVFIVTLIFGTGYFLGARSGDHHGDGRGPNSMMFQHSAPGQPPLLFPMGPRAQQERPLPPGFGSGIPGLTPPQPGAPATTAPARP